MEKTETLFFGSSANRRLLEGMKIAYDTIINAYQKDSKEDEESLFSKVEAEEASLKCGIYFIQKAFSQKDPSSLLSSLLVYHLSNELFQLIFLGHNSILLKNSLEKALSLFLSSLKAKTTKLKTKKERYQFGKTFIPDDEVLLNTLLEALEKSGKEQNIVIKYNPLTSSQIELAEGIYIKSGLISPYFMTNGEDSSLEFENVSITFSETKLSSSFEILDMLKKSPLLLIAPEISGDALSSLIANKLENQTKVCPIKTPLEIASLKKISPEKKAAKVYADMDCTVIFEKTNDLICIVHTNQRKKNVTKNKENLKLCLNETFLSDESEIGSTLQEIDPFAFSPAEKPILKALENSFLATLSALSNPHFKKQVLSFYILSKALEVATSIVSPLLLSEALLMEQRR